VRFWITLFDDFYAADCVGKEVDLEELAELIRNTEAPDKQHLPLLKLARFGSVRTPANSLRHDRNVLSVSGLEIDYDGGSMPLQEAVDRLDGAAIAYLLYSTSRHTPAAPRWRVLLPFAKELPPGERAELANRINGVLGGGLAGESWGLSQPFLYGRIEGAFRARLRRCRRNSRRGDRARRGRFALSAVHQARRRSRRGQARF
jgi:hypothetical protein